MHASIDLSREQSGLLEDTHVPGDRGQRHVEWPCEPRHRRLALGESFEDRASCGIGERREGAVENFR